MKIDDFYNISMKGRMAYAILCVEKYLLAKYPNDDWSVLSKWMWDVTSNYWDEWDYKFMEIIPEYLFEFNTYAESGFERITEDEYNLFVSLLKGKSDDLNQLLLKLHKIQEVYCYSSVPGHGDEASEIVLEACSILEKENIDLPDIESVSFSSFSEKDGWGERFDGTKLSLILNK